MFFMLSPWTWSYIAKTIYCFVSDIRFLLTRRYDEEYVRGNIFNNSPTRGILLFKLIPKC
ncbi:hypothetical protein DXM32_03355 [Salmonella enterica]|nr:hypothetical protein [Salmonella enterica]EBK9379529.1 hypothetical protein [Salmonella enterica]